MRAAAVLAACLIAVPAGAADAPPAPDGWTRADDGTYTHTQSGIACPPAKGAYTLVQVDGPSDPGTLGVCQYTGGPMRIGKVRVRKFIDGVGETPLAISNDRTLMGAIPAQGVPAGGQIVSAYRAGPGPRIDGTETAQFVLTSRVGDLLVDCITQVTPVKDETDRAFNDFMKSCMPSK